MWFLRVMVIWFWRQELQLFMFKFLRQSTLYVSHGEKKLLHASFGVVCSPRNLQLSNLGVFVPNSSWNCCFSAKLTTSLMVVRGHVQIRFRASVHEVLGVISTDNSNQLLRNLPHNLSQWRLLGKVYSYIDFKLGENCFAGRNTFAADMLSASIWPFMVNIIFWLLFFCWDQFTPLCVGLYFRLISGRRRAFLRFTIAYKASTVI